MSASVLIEAVQVEGFGGGGVVAPAFGDVQVAGVFDGRDDGGADGGQVGRPAAGTAGRRGTSGLNATLATVSARPVRICAANVSRWPRWDDLHASKSLSNGCA